MKKVLTGKQAVLYVRIDSTFYPALCAVSNSFQFNVEEIEKVTRTSGRYKAREGRMIDWGIGLTGLTKVDNADGQAGWFWLLQHAGTNQYVRLRYTDSDNNVVNVEGEVLIKQGQVDSAVEGFTMASLYFPGSGAFSTDAAAEVPLPVLYKLYLTTTETAFEVSHADLGGATEIMLVLREDGGYTEVTGTPTGRQFKYIDNTTSGTLRFDSSLPFNPGEIVYVQFMKAS